MSIDCHIKFDGVSGESGHGDHKDEIDVMSWSWGITNKSSSGQGGGSGKGKAEPHALQFTHLYDKASPVLKKHCVSGKHFDKVVLTVSKAGEGQKAFKTMTMKEAYITDVHINASAGGDLVENVTLTFTDVEIEYKPQDAMGNLGGAVKFGWDVNKVQTR